MLYLGGIFSFLFEFFRTLHPGQGGHGRGCARPSTARPALENVVPDTRGFRGVQFGSVPLPPRDVHAPARPGLEHRRPGGRTSD